MDERREQLRRKRRTAIWKWRWLGLRDSTPGFKGMIVILTLVAMYIAVHLLTAL